MNRSITNGGQAYALSRRVERDIPEHWGKSDLTQFLEVMEENGIASFAGLPAWFDILERIDATIVTNAPNLFHRVDGSGVTAARLYMRAFGAYRAAARLSVSGQVYETAVLRRSIIEHATYAWACGQSQSHRDVWLARARGEQERKAARKAFQWNGLMQMLGIEDEKLARDIRSHYEKSLDFGAHPNVEGVDLSSQLITTDEEGAEFNTIYAHGPNTIIPAIAEIICIMQLVYRLLLHTVGHRVRLLSIDQRFEADIKVFRLLIDEHQKGKSENGA